MKKKINFNRVVKVPEEGLTLPDGNGHLIRRDYHLKERVKNVLIPEEYIQRRVEALACEICSDYQKQQQLYMISLLKGAFVFKADLGREICRHSGMEIHMDFYETHTYGMEIKGDEQKVRTVKFLRRPKYIPDIDVLLVDDIGDTLVTVDAVRKDMVKTLGFKPEKIKFCFLLNKILENPPPVIKKLKEELKPDYVGFDIPDLWIAGYGIDAGGDFRLLSSIISVKEEYYR